MLIYQLIRARLDSPPLLKSTQSFSPERTSPSLAIMKAREMANSHVRTSHQAREEGAVRECVWEQYGNQVM